MNALERWQTAISSNLAAGAVPGYKKEETSFSSALAGTAQLQPDDASADVKQVMPVATSKMTDSQGTLRQTGQSLDFALQGPGYFQVSTPSGGKAYTRDGEFHLDPKGNLVNVSGMQVQGDKGPIKIDLSNGPVAVDRTGLVSQSGTPLGKFAIADLSKAGPLQRSADGLVAPTNANAATQVKNPEVMQGYVEDSNVVPLREMVNLINVSRAYDISQKLVTSMDQTTHSAIDALGTP